MTIPTEAFFHAVVEHLPTGIWVCDVHHRIVYANAALAKAVQTTVDGLMGCHVLEDIPRMRDEDFARPFLAAVESHQTQTYSCQIVTADGRHIWLGGELAPLMEDGRYWGMLCTAQDITVQKSTEDKSRENEALLRTVLDELPDPVLLKDHKGDFLLCNSAVARLYNTVPEAMVGKHDDDFGVPKEMADFFRQNVLGIMARGETETVFEDSRDAVTGETHHYKSIKKPFKNREGQNQILVIAHDITDVIRSQQKVAESERRLQDVLRVAQEGVWDWHVPSGRVLHNAQWYTMLGMTEAECPETLEAFSNLVHPEDRAHVWAKVDSLLDGNIESYSSVHRLIGKRGTLWVQDRGGVTERDQDGKPIRVTGAFLDITARREAETELIEAQQAAQQASLAKSQFLATMSHEIRTPLNGILGMTQLLMLPDQEQDQVQDYAQTILSSGQTLLALLNDILDLSKVEAGKMELMESAFEPESVLEEIATLFAEPAHDRHISIGVAWNGPRPARYRADPIRLRQMLSNLVSNAIKFSSQGSIRVEATELGRGPGGAELRFTVTDQGIGVPAAMQSKLFKPFSQVDMSNTRAHGGTGLGLSIVRSPARLMGGDVGLESEEGSGSRFWFTIKAQVSNCDAGGSRVPTEVAGLPRSEPVAGHTVLVVEDNPVNLRVIKAMLERLGYEVISAQHGQEAVDKVTHGAVPDLVLMDCQMPVMDGYIATQTLREWESELGRSHMPIVALTANAFEEDRRRCLAVGMDDYLSKPVQMSDLGELLGRWLHR